MFMRILSAIQTSSASRTASTLYTAKLLCQLRECEVLLPACLYSQAKRWEDFPNLTFTFDCTDRAVGFYADTEHHCQIFHICDEDGRRIPYICANETSFNQEFRVCDWEYNFDCSQATQWSVLRHQQYQPRSPDSVIR
jgi:hypothetical protein